MKFLAVVLILFILAPATASAQCTVPGCDAATAVVANGRATGAAILTAVAPPTQTPVPTWTPQPTWTPAPTVTPQPTATETARPTATGTATAQPSATSAATATMTGSATATRETATAPQGEDITSQRWQVFGILLFCIALLGGLLWFMRDRTFYIPRGDRHDDRKQ